jgi:hypothetical protein
MYVNPSLRASERARVLLPAAAGPSMATISRLCASVAIHLSFLKKTPRKLTVWHGHRGSFERGSVSTCYSNVF